MVKGIAPMSGSGPGIAAGFTLVELMITLVIVGILAAYGVPSVRDMIQAGRLRSASSDFYSALILARSEAIKRRITVTVAPLSTGWNSGWTVKAGATTYGSHEALPSSVIVQVGVPAAATTSPIVYGMNGRVSSGSQTVIFYTSPEVAQPRCLSIDPSGMPRSQIDTNMKGSDGCY